jgi:hypothetical protein
MRGFVATLIFVLAVANPACAIVTSDEPGSHVATPGQPAFGVNLDGVVLLGTRVPNVNSIGRLKPRCSAALISDRHLLCAGHCFDEEGDGMVDPLLTAVPHVAAFELAEGLVMVNIDPTTIQFPENWPQQRADIAVVQLTDVAPAAAPRYPLYGGVNELGRAAVMVGYGATGHGANGATLGSAHPSAKRAGLNRIEGIRGDLPGVEFLEVDFDSGQPADNSLATLGVTSDLGFGSDEVLFAPGDSGGPMFVGEAIVGVNAFTNDIQDNSRWGEVCFATRVSYFRNSIMTATGGTAVFVPEPGGNSLFLIASLVGWLNRRRHSERLNAPRRDVAESRTSTSWKAG